MRWARLANGSPSGGDDVAEHDRVAGDDGDHQADRLVLGSEPDASMPAGRPKYQTETVVGSRNSSRYSSLSATQAKRTVGVAGRTRYSQRMVATNIESAAVARQVSYAQLTSVAKYDRVYASYPRLRSSGGRLMIFTA